jgi:hypothetical protein
MKRIFLLFSLLIISSILLCLDVQSQIHGQSNDTLCTSQIEQYRSVNDFVDDNEACFACHCEARYQLKDELSGRVITRFMCENRVIHREEYYKSNHKSFKCLDCHSYDYEVFPHSLEGRLEEQYACLDCHGYDEDYAHFNFEEIEEEYIQSIHYVANPEEFSCWKCHNPHTYHISIRNTENLETTIAYDNAICLQCHANFNRFQLLTDREGINVIQRHEWLPNQALHFQNVRCIECHTQINDSILVAHLVRPKENAVRRCSECHSTNSILMHTLYKFQSKEARNQYGFFNGVVMNEGYVIGANRNYFLNVVSLLIFGIAFVSIGIHITFRILRKA